MTIANAKGTTMNATETFRYSITSHLQHRYGEMPRRIYDAVAVCKTTGIRKPLGCTDNRVKAKALCDAHRSTATEAK